MIKKCSVEGCDRQARTKGMCAKHYSNFWRTGKAEAEKPWGKYIPKGKCSVEGCDRDVSAQGVCATHYTNKTENGKRAQKKFRQTDRRKVITARYEAKESTKEKRREKSKTEKGKENNVKRQQKRRAAKRGNEAEIFSPKDVYERDNWTCYLCGEKINKSQKAPHPKSPSLDHVVPICKGGGHVLNNVKAAHLRCNQSKGSKTLEEYREFCERRQNAS